MQTIKTAALVVLLLTVIYGGYVSLTTPPEPIPPEVADLIKMDDDFSIESGLPDTMSLEGIVADPQQPPAGQTAPAVTPTGEGSFGASFADLAPGPAANGSPATSNELAVVPDPAAVAQAPAPTPNKLPAIGDVTASVQAAAGHTYPSTGNTIALPDPSAVEFDASTGTAFKSDSMTALKSLTPTPEAAVAQLPTPSGDLTPPPGPVAQAAAIEPKKNVGVTNAIQTADRQYGKDLLKEALSTLSVFYSAPDVSSSQREDLLRRLDPLAREVIYSKRHLLEQPYRVARGEKLADIAAKYNVPWQLLANINDLKDPQTLLPGTELKVVRGPFSAQVDLEQKELTLFLNELYAGRFPVDVGSDPAPKAGTFMVQDKQTGRAYYATAGPPVPADSPSNPYGGYWIDLGEQICIHGSPNPTRPTDQGCISLAGDYADDLFGILSQGSSVTIRR